MIFAIIIYAVLWLNVAITAYFLWDYNFNSFCSKDSWNKNRMAYVIITILVSPISLMVAIIAYLTTKKSRQ
jgi:hypothetical protein